MGAISGLLFDIGVEKVVVPGNAFNVIEKEDLKREKNFYKKGINK